STPPEPEVSDFRPSRHAATPSATVPTPSAGGNLVQSLRGLRHALRVGNLILRAPEVCLMERNYFRVRGGPLNWFVTRGRKKQRIVCRQVVRPLTRVRGSRRCRGGAMPTDLQWHI